MPSLIPMRGLRLDDELYLKLKAIAKIENRSYNQQAVYILKAFVSDYEAAHGVIEVDTDALYE
jgi:hypothetical protein